jgi:multicomponent Na+:H+ antiporter subunit E
VSGQQASWRAFFSPGILRRFAVYLTLWIVLMGTNGADLAVGVVTAACATLTSVFLLPVTDKRISPAALARLALRLPWQSLIAGIDVARRALDPRLPLQPGFVNYATGLDDGPGRNAFRVLTSLQPGTLPVSVEGTGDLLVHCLDTSQPVAAQMAAEEALFAQLTGGGAGPAMDHG